MLLSIHLMILCLVLTTRWRNHTNLLEWKFNKKHTGKMKYNVSGEVESLRTGAI